MSAEIARQQLQINAFIIFKSSFLRHPENG